ncbi:MAG: gas vesicle protein [Longimicrobiaceae bacterium]
MAEPYPVSPSRPQGLVDILDRVLDKGLVVAGDVKINLANVELLTIRVRLLVCSIDKAEQIGLDWWKRDPAFSGAPQADALPGQVELEERIQSLERRLEASERSKKRVPRRTSGGAKKKG